MLSPLRGYRGLMLRSPWADAHGYLLSPHSRLLGNAANRLAERIGDRRVLSLLSGLLFGVYDRDNTTGDCPDFRGADGVALRARRTCAETLIHGAHAPGYIPSPLRGFTFSPPRNSVMNHFLCRSVFPRLTPRHRRGFPSLAETRRDSATSLCRPNRKTHRLSLEGCNRACPAA